MRTRLWQRAGQVAVALLGKFNFKFKGGFAAGFAG